MNKNKKEEKILITILIAIFFTIMIIYFVINPINIVSIAANFIIYLAFGLMGILYFIVLMGLIYYIVGKLIK